MKNFRSKQVLPASETYQEFLRRASQIPFLGLGLSVDVYSPDIFELCDELRNRQLKIAYLEIFHAAPEALESVRAQLPGIPLAYHAEGLWFTQPDWETAYFSQSRLEAAARALRILQSQWVNQECATKEINGFAFGTYLPPLFTRESAEVTAYHTRKAQQRLDEFDWEVQPLLLLEGPPLSYFSMGDISYAEFFANVTSQAPCGLVLDLGHVWTVYRYTGAWQHQSLNVFFESFLNHFPLERVIQIHIAGLDCHPKLSNPLGQENNSVPLWVDAHSASIPKELCELLIRVLQEPRLTNLKGIALEVDSKDIPLICWEISVVMEMVTPFIHSRPQVSGPAPEVPYTRPFYASDSKSISEIRHMLTRQYKDYLALAIGKGRKSRVLPQEWEKEAGKGLLDYATQYLPYEILTWGGNVRELFPKTCEILDGQGISLHQFLEFWLTHNRATEPEYDFFLIKIHQFLKFIRHEFPLAFSTAQQEAEILSHGYFLACKGSIHTTSLAG